MKILKLLSLTFVFAALAVSSKAQCTANGTVTITGNPGEIFITDNSTSSGGGIYSYISFYNNTTGQNAGFVNLQPSVTTATYTFTENGSYSYYLEAGDSLTSCYDSIGGTFTITNLPSCSAVANVSVNQTGTPGLLVVTDNSTSSTPTSVSWMAFYDQSGTWLGNLPLQPTTNSGTFQVNANGVYFYSFVVQDSTNSCEDSISAAITINGFGSSSCDANYSFYPDSVGNGVYFDAPTQSGSGYSYYWDFGDGSTSNIADPFHNYGANGTYTACLTVWNNNNFCSDTVCNVITVNNGAAAGCSGNADFYYSTNNGNDFYFAPNSVLSNATYQWDFGNGNSSFNAVTQETYNATSSGWYAVCLIVVDANNCTDYYCDSIYVTASVTGPSCDATFYSYVDSSVANAVYLYNYGNNGSGATYLWDLGDGTTATGQYPSHTYASSGWYAVCLTVSDNTGAGCTQTYCDSVYADGGVTAPSCNADFILFQDSLGSGVYYAWNTSSGNNLSYFWDFGDGNTSTTAFPTHTYNAVGVYGICLSVSDNNGCASTHCDTLYIVVKSAGTTLNVMEPGAFAGIEQINAFNEVQLFPNPNNGDFKVAINVSESVDATIFISNLMGQTVKNLSVQLYQGENLINMNESLLPTGVYILNVVNESTGEMTVKRLIKD